jgi:purine nucleosidase
MSNKLIIDTDVGVDDAIALLMALADPNWEIIGITAVSGNVPLERVVRNIGIVLDAAGAQPIPFFRGAARPLLAEPVHADSVHGQDGLGDAGFRASSRTVADQEHAALAIVRLARENPGATLLALGPLTNVALALSLEPELPRLLKQTVVMGGAAYAQGNITAVAEFNIYADVEAAALVFERGLNPIVLDWHTTLRTPVLWKDWEALLNAGPLGQQFVAPMTQALAERSREHGREGMLWPDPLALAVLLDPQCATTYPARVTVDTSHGIARGMTVIDTMRRNSLPFNATIVDSVDVGRFQQLLERAFRLPCHL